MTEAMRATPGAGYILAGRPSGLGAIVDGRATNAGMQHLFGRPGEWCLCGEVMWLQVQRAEKVTELTWICTRCKAVAAGEPDPCLPPPDDEDQVAAIRRGQCPACAARLTDPQRSPGGWRHCRPCRRGWAVETRACRARPTWRDWPHALATEAR